MAGLDQCRRERASGTETASGKESEADLDRAPHHEAARGWFSDCVQRQEITPPAKSPPGTMACANAGATTAQMNRRDPRSLCKTSSMSPGTTDVEIPDRPAHPDA